MNKMILMLLFFSVLAPTRPVKDLLQSDESIINPFYMRQLLEYGIKLGLSQKGDIDPDSLLREAEVYIFSFVLDDSCVYLFFFHSALSPN
jgi:hypothetical protein